MPPSMARMTKFVIEHEVLTIEELELVDDEDSYRQAAGPEERWGLAPSLRIPDLEIERATRAFTTQEDRTNFGDPTNRDAATSFALQKEALQDKAGEWGGEVSDHRAVW